MPLKFVKEIKDIVLTEAESVGSSAIFECLVSPSTAITTWMKDGSNIRESPKHRFIADGKDRKLHIIDVQLSDAGEYTCVLRLGNKEKTSTAKLIVEGNVQLRSWSKLNFTRETSVATFLVVSDKPCEFCCAENFKSDYNSPQNFLCGL